MEKDPVLLLNRLESDGFPPMPGKAVYAVFVFNLFTAGAQHLLYIGSTDNLEKRRSGNKHPYKVAFKRFQGYVVCFKYYYTDDYREDEKVLIRHYRPIFNCKLYK